MSNAMLNEIIQEIKNLSNEDKQKQMDFEKFNGIVEMGETYFLYSEKGKRGIQERKRRRPGGSSQFRGISCEQVCVLVARDSQEVYVFTNNWPRSNREETTRPGNRSEIVFQKYSVHTCMARFQKLCERKKNRPLYVQVRQ